MMPAFALPLLFLIFADTGTLAERFKQAQELQSKGRTSEALKLFRDLAEADSGNASLLMHVALAHYEAGEYKEAVRWSHEALKLRDDLAPAWLFGGAGNLRLGRFELAVSQLQRAVELKPNDRNARLLLAEALLSAGDHAGAITAYRDAASVLPDNPRTWYGLARSADELCASETGDSQRFCRIRDDAANRLKALPPSAQTHALAGHRLYSAGRAEQAIPHWEQALKLSPDDPGLKIGLVLALTQLRLHDRALPILESAVKMHPQSSELHYLHGMALLNLARPADSIASLTTAVQLNENHLGAHAALGHALLQMGNAEQAIPHLEAALTMDKDGVQHYQLARAYRLAGRTRASAATLKKYKELRQNWETKQRAQPALPHR